ncbi:PrgI family protein [Enterococcus hirae]
MSIRVKVPKEIKDYQEKLMGGMSVRQLVFFVLAVLISVGVTAYCVLVLHMSVDAAGYIVIPLLIPIVAFGWIRKEGMPLEKYGKIILNYYSKTGIRIYQTKERSNLNDFRKKRFQKVKETTKR